MPRLEQWTFEAWVGKVGSWYVPDPATGCWNWRRCLKDGYGILANGRNGSMAAHRLSYHVLRGPIPHGLTIDHLCRNRACVNPAHMEAVTLAINGLRGFGVCANNKRKTHCKNGHLLEGPNIRLEDGVRRRCMICTRERVNAWARANYDPAKRHEKWLRAKQRRNNK